MLTYGVRRNQYLPGYVKVSPDSLIDFGTAALGFLKTDRAVAKAKALSLERYVTETFIL